MTPRRKAFDEAVEGLELEDPETALAADEEPDRFLLVQVSVFSRNYWVTTHATAQDAASYVANEENTEDWPIESFVDLDTGARGDIRASYAPVWPHADAYGAMCKDAGDGTCEECGVALVLCETCKGRGYHRPNCPEGLT